MSLKHHYVAGYDRAGKRRYYVDLPKQRGNRTIYVVRNEQGNEVASGQDAQLCKEHILHYLGGEDITVWEYDPKLGFQPAG